MATIPYDASRTALYAPERRETLFEPGARYTSTQLAVEAARLAYYRAETAQTEHARLVEALARAGFEAPAFFIEGATFAFGALHAGEGTALVAFRGTQPDEIRHLATNLQAQQTAWAPTGGRVHAGFARAAHAVLPQIQGWLAGPASRRSSLVLAGHSLGAALATLAATVTPPTLLVTLGSPRVGDAAFVSVLAGADIVRLVDGCDVVTQLPPALSFYAHAGPATYITCDQAVCVIDPAPSFIDADRAEGRARYASEHAWKAGAVLLRELADHAPVNYARAYFG
jgi:hypothetical protein